LKLAPPHPTKCSKKDLPFGRPFLFD